MREEPVQLPPDVQVARIAARQHGVISLTQLRAAGIDRNAITRRIRSQRLHRIHRGVYAAGHGALSQEGKWMAAVLTCGNGAVLSYRSAGALWRIVPPSRGPVDVTVPRRGGRNGRRGIRVHRSHTLLPSHCTLRNAIPVTKPARTLDDLHRVLTRKEFAAALREAEFLRLPIGDRFEPDHTRSELERIFVRLCGRRHLPAPEINVRIGPYTADFLWRGQRLVVETDGWSTHRGRRAFEEDHARDLDLKLWGYEVLRFTYRQITRDPDGVAAAVRVQLGRGPGG